MSGVKLKAVNSKLKLNDNSAKSQSNRAVVSRKWRCTNREKKRFNALLCGYINVKYNNIYSECRQFYNTLIDMYPEARDLTKTRAYKEWKEQQGNHPQNNLNLDLPFEQQPECSLDLPVEQESSEQQESFENNVQAECSLDLSVEQESSEQQESFENSVQAECSLDLSVEQESNERQESFENNEQDDLTVAVNEMLHDNLVNVNEVDNMINEIIMDLEQDDAILDILNEYREHDMNNQLVLPNYQDEDEGIGLNLETELEGIIEPFNYEEEVEPFE